MTNAELILKLVEMLIESEKKQEAKANEQNGQGKDQYISNHKGVVTSICYSFIFLCKTKEMPSSIASLSNYMTFAELQSIFKLLIFYYLKLKLSNISPKKLMRNITKILNFYDKSTLIVIFIVKSKVL